MINRRDFCKGIFGASAVLGYPFADSKSSTTEAEDIGEVLRGIADVLNDPCEVFSFQKPDLMKIMTQQTGRLVVGTGFGSGMDAAGQAGRNACNCALFDKRYLKEAVTINLIITGGHDLMVYELIDAMEPLWHYGADKSKGFNWQAVTKDNMAGKRRVTIIACIA